jgi:hypothetical protein
MLRQHEAERAGRDQQAVSAKETPQLVDSARYTLLRGLFGNAERLAGRAQAAPFEETQQHGVAILCVEVRDGTMQHRFEFVPTRARILDFKVAQHFLRHFPLAPHAA